jgi:DNA-binding transcriptional MerR regulator
VTDSLPKKLYFRIGEVAGIVGVEPHVLRYWEREFRSNIRPQKSARGQRVYSRRDVENLLRVRELLYTQGFTIAGARKQLIHGPATAKSTPPPASDAAEEPTTDGPGKPPPPVAASPREEPPPNEGDETLRETLIALRDEVTAFLDDLGG